MKLATLQRPGSSPFLAACIEDGFVDLLAVAADGRGGSSSLETMRALILGGEQALDLARRSADRARELGWVAAIGDLRVLPPLPDPPALRCCSVFPGHFRNTKRTVTRWLAGRPANDLEPPPAFYSKPSYYKGNHLNFTGPGDPIPWPDYAQWLDFELELAMIVGSGAVDVQPEDWKRHVFGWTIYNDVSARHPLIEEVQLPTGPSKGKDFDGANILGPLIVTADEFDGTCAVGRARVNGEQWGEASSAEMAHSWGAILAHRSRAERLYPGEIIASGCFTGCSGLDHDRAPCRGDLIELEIDGIGVLRNRIAG